MLTAVYPGQADATRRQLGQWGQLLIELAREKARRWIAWIEKGLDPGKMEEASKGTVRQTITIRAGIDSDHARTINKFIKEKAPKGISSQTQGDQLRVSGKKRDDLQNVIAALKAEDAQVPR